MSSMAPSYLFRSQSNIPAIISKIRVYKPVMGQEATIVVDMVKDGSGNFGGTTKNVNTFDLIRAISTGEIINPNAPLTREQAIAKLKEAKDLLELDMMSQEEFNSMREELTPIIRGN